MKEMTVSIQLAEATVKYLLTRPWAEVNPLIQGWMKSKEEQDGDGSVDDKAGSSEQDSASS